MRRIIKPDHRTVMRLLIGNDEGRRTHERVVRGLRQRRREYARGSDASFAWYSEFATEASLRKMNGYYEVTLTIVSHPSSKEVVP